MANLNDNSNRRQQYGVGRGIVGKLLSGQVIKSRQRAVRHQLDELEDYRPNFTYWITTVQTVVLVISLAWYGFAPFGTGVARSEGLVMSGSLTLDQVWPLTKFPFFVKKSLIFPKGKFMTPYQGNAFLFRSYQQLPYVRL